MNKSTHGYKKPKNGMNRICNDKDRTEKVFLKETGQEEKFKLLFGNDIDVYFTFNGTGANVIGLSVLTQSYNSIICPSTVHVETKRPDPLSTSFSLAVLIHLSRKSEWSVPSSTSAILIDARAAELQNIQHSFG